MEYQFSKWQTAAILDLIASHLGFEGHKYVE
jgi:hypothetical protein